MMVEENEDRHRTAYTVTVDYKHGASRPTDTRTTHLPRT